VNYPCIRDSPRIRVRPALADSGRPRSQREQAYGGEGQVPEPILTVNENSTVLSPRHHIPCFMSVKSTICGLQRLRGRWLGDVPLVEVIDVRGKRMALALELLPLQVGADHVGGDLSGCTFAELV
jgi:hypothetical protein